MTKLLSACLALAMLASITGAALAQGAPTPKTPADCKANEVWDATTRTCKPKS